MTKKSMTISKAMAAIGLCVCMSVGMVACDGADAQVEAEDQATEEVQGSDEDGSSDGSDASESDADDAASDASPSGEEGESQGGESSGQEATSSSSEGGSTQAAGSNSGSAQKASNSSTSSNSGASNTTSASTSASTKANTNASSSASSAATHTHSYTIPITEQVWHDATYETVVWCNMCGCACSEAHYEAHVDTFLANGCTGTVPSTSTKRIETSAGYYETVTTGYKCSCGAVK